MQRTWARDHTAQDTSVLGQSEARPALDMHGGSTRRAPVPPHWWFDEIEATWEAAGQFARKWLPPLSGCAESRGMILNAMQLIQAVILHVRLTYAPLHHHLAIVHQLLQAEADRPGSLFAAMMTSQAPEVAQEAWHAQANQANPWFGGLSQALLCARAWEC